MESHVKVTVIAVRSLLQASGVVRWERRIGAEGTASAWEGDERYMRDVSSL